MLKRQPVEVSGSLIDANDWASVRPQAVDSLVTAPLVSLGDRAR